MYRTSQSPTNKLFHSRFSLFPVIKEESIESRSEVISFNKSGLKKTETCEKNTLPTAATLVEELRPECLPDVSGVAKFDLSSLKRTETVEKSVLPDADSKLHLHMSLALLPLMLTY